MDREMKCHLWFFFGGSSSQVLSLFVFCFLRNIGSAGEENIQ